MIELEKKGRKGPIVFKRKTIVGPKIIFSAWIFYKYFQFIPLQCKIFCCSTQWCAKLNIEKQIRLQIVFQSHIMISFVIHVIKDLGKILLYDKRLYLMGAPSINNNKLQILLNKKMTKRGEGVKKSPLLRRHSLWRAPYRRNYSLQLKVS